MTSIGEISAARMTTPGAAALLATPCGDFRRAFTTSLTPRLRVLFFAAIAEFIFIFSFSVPIGRVWVSLDPLEKEGTNERKI